MKAFLLGRAGSGKSALARIIEKTAHDRDWNVQHIYDYNRLYSMFQKEIDAGIPDKKRKFRAAGQGFDVVDFDVLNTVLEQIAVEVRTDESIHPDAHKLFLIEFARQEYRRALHIFGNEFLNGAHVFYVKAELELCIERVHQRAEKRKTKFDHSVSDEIMRSYYGTDDWLDGRFTKYLDYLQSDNVNLHIQELDNTGTIQEFENKAAQVADSLIPEFVAV